MGLDDDPVKVYAQEIANVTPLTQEEEDHLFLEVNQPGEQGENAQRRLIESKLYLVLQVAERHAPSGLSMVDLIQEGNLGLFRAIREFPESHLNDFSPYAVSCIEEAISTAIAKAKSH